MFGARKTTCSPIGKKASVAKAIFLTRAELIQEANSVQIVSERNPFHSGYPV